MTPAEAGAEAGRRLAAQYPLTADQVVRVVQLLSLVPPGDADGGEPS